MWPHRSAYFKHPCDSSLWMAAAQDNYKHCCLLMSSEIFPLTSFQAQLLQPSEKSWSRSHCWMAPLLSWPDLSLEWERRLSLCTTCHSSTCCSCALVIMRSAQTPLLPGLSEPAQPLFAQSAEHQSLHPVARLHPGNRANPPWPLTRVTALGWEENGSCRNQPLESGEDGGMASSL